MASKCQQCDNESDSLRTCAKCHTTKYCNRECQAADWTSHKRECARLAGERADATASASASNTGTATGSDTSAKPFTAIHNGTFLQDKPKEKIYEILIDLVRLRQDDTLKFEGDTMRGTVMNGETTSENALRGCIRRARATPGLLPDDWRDEHTEACVRFGLESPRFSLRAAPEKSDFVKAWGDSAMPMKLRMLGERIYGNTPGTTPGQGEAMLRVQMAAEGGGLHTSNLDLSSFTRA